MKAFYMIDTVAGRTSQCKKSENKNIEWSEICYLPIYCLLLRAKNKYITVFIEQRFARRMLEANLECTLMASRLFGEPLLDWRPLGIVITPVRT